MREKLIKLIESCDADFEKTCPQYLKVDKDCATCEYDEMLGCNYSKRQADYLLENGVVVKERGKWANAYSSGTHLYRCTECGEYIEAIWTGGYDFKYCPNCGAKMEW